MGHYPYLIVGGGMTAAAIQGIREVDSAGVIGVIGGEQHPPYQRPPLSKALWKGKSLDTMWIDSEKQGIEFALGRRAHTLDLERKRVSDDQVSSTPLTNCCWRRAALRDTSPGAVMR
jgi:3-phenylpropionate/trans-cinnamate dioxygenase ferredoxin reductase component